VVRCGGCVGVEYPPVELCEACRGEEEVCDGGGHCVFVREGNRVLRLE
jgi:hypothetical protein